MPATSSQIFKKIVLILLPIVIIGLFVIALWDYSLTRESVQKAINNELIAIASTGAIQIDGEIFDAIRNIKDFESDNYFNILV